jgi:hypothetical protein
MSDRKRNLTSGPSSREVDAFLEAVKQTPAVRSQSTGRLMFAMDATASREPTWDRACQLQAEMFTAAAEQGGLEVQLVYFRGFHEFHVTPWAADAPALARSMTRVHCAGGLTQIERVLRHAGREAGSRQVNALVYVGDCMEENVDLLCQRAGELGLKGLPAFMFQEGFDTVAERAFKEIARLSRGAWSRFDAGSAGELTSLLRAVAVYASGGAGALRTFARNEGGLAKQLAHQLD